MDSAEAGSIAQVAATLLIAIAVALAQLPMRQYRDYVFGITSVLAGFIVLLTALYGMAAEPAGLFGVVYRLCLYIMMAGMTGLVTLVFYSQLAEINIARLQREDAARLEAEEAERSAPEPNLFQRWRRGRGVKVSAKPSGSART